MMIITWLISYWSFFFKKIFWPIRMQNSGFGFNVFEKLHDFVWRCRFRSGNVPVVRVVANPYRWVFLCDVVVYYPTVKRVMGNKAIKSKVHPECYFFGSDNASAKGARFKVSALRGMCVFARICVSVYTAAILAVCLYLPGSFARFFWTRSMAGTNTCFCIQTSGPLHAIPSILCVQFTGNKHDGCASLFLLWFHRENCSFSRNLNFHLVVT